MVISPGSLRRFGLSLLLLLLGLELGLLVTLSCRCMGPDGSGKAPGMTGNGSGDCRGGSIR
jgi:hypothetical protein